MKRLIIFLVAVLMTSPGYASELWTVDVTAVCDDYNSVGPHWDYEFYVNDEPVASGDQVYLDDNVTVAATITENDKYPDVGEKSEAHIITTAEVRSGFTVEFTVPVVENKGRYKGNIAEWYVTFDFY